MPFCTRGLGGEKVPLGIGANGGEPGAACTGDSGRGSGPIVWNSDGVDRVNERE